MDDGDGSENYNTYLKLNNLERFEGELVNMFDEPQYLYVHRQDGVSIGGKAEFHGQSATTVHSDLRNSEFIKQVMTNWMKSQ